MVRILQQETRVTNQKVLQFGVEVSPKGFVHPCGTYSGLEVQCRNPFLRPEFMLLYKI